MQLTYLIVVRKMTKFALLGSLATLILSLGRSPPPNGGRLPRGATSR